MSLRKSCRLLRLNASSFSNLPFFREFSSASIAAPKAWTASFTQNETNASSMKRRSLGRWPHSFAWM